MYLGMFNSSTRLFCLQNGYMKDAFFLKVETMHVQDKIDIDNVRMPSLLF